jgi:epsilon-lactone hydrolase
VLLQVGATELLFDDASRMHERILAAGGSSTLSVYDAAHAWQLVGPVLPEARRAVAEVAAFVESHAATAEPGPTRPTASGAGA